MTHRSALFAAVLGLGRAGSNIGDHWIQNDYCARVKGATDDKPVYLTTDDPDDEPTVHGTTDGIKACAWHCLTYTATQALAVGAGARVLGIRLHPGAAAAALALSFVTHYAADRRVPDGLLETLATKTGKGNFWRLADHGINGAYCLDNAWHHGWETTAALVATIGATTR
ncbi:hypothetical protein [Streptomyces roseicoloratus]|uniref:hypothetical protein n=1 Tax=Streptomyces roseicoloratus TaxID=2508722 RepID=UPI0010098E10|nr:hypothetical protein [Streptomyces roseicoloratus]